MRDYISKEYAVNTARSFNWYRHKWRRRTAASGDFRFMYRTNAI